MTGRIIPRMAAVCVAVILWLMLAMPISAAAPWIIIIEGEAMDEPAYITDFFDNQNLLGSRDDGDLGKLDDRPYLHLYLFWGGNWEDYVSSGKPLEDLEPRQADQHGRFYPAYDGQPAILEIVPPDMTVAGDGPGIVNETGLEILQRYGVPVALDAIPSLPGMPNTGGGGMAGERTTTNGSIVALTFGIAVVAAVLISSLLVRRFGWG